jgi:hypothetical protein
MSLGGRGKTMHDGLQGRRQRTVRDDQGPLLLEERRQLCAELTAARDKLGVCGR